ncbi:hypothetical protein KY386_01985 [Candidatus Parcubacteria bacterium]|nr:hypothetical protein [Candidatus Parcubacteria bacterium]
MIDLRSSEAPQPEAHPGRFTGASKQHVPAAILAFCLFVLDGPGMALQAAAGMWLALNPIAWALQRLWGWDRQRFQQLQNEPT